eukprot:TRINITY_DN12325_c0_g1_i1.p1 TRINITY_DN12325_c0_g1~~TRINITY_DN12325_c0_g1_i1.p1  ORF type:complete len:468 (+),score=53.74 TRINITY_DN12325_c0_g1_i1:30-1433(+)
MLFTTSKMHSNRTEFQTNNKIFTKRIQSMASRMDIDDFFDMFIIGGLSKINYIIYLPEDVLMLLACSLDLILDFVNFCSSCRLFYDQLSNMNQAWKIHFNRRFFPITIQKNTTYKDAFISTYTQYHLWSNNVMHISNIYTDGMWASNGDIVVTQSAIGLELDSLVVTSLRNNTITRINLNIMDIPTSLDVDQFDICLGTSSGSILIYDAKSKNLKKSLPVTKDRNLIGVSAIAYVKGILAVAAYVDNIILYWSSLGGYKWELKVLDNYTNVVVSEIEILSTYIVVYFISHRINIYNFDGQLHFSLEHSNKVLQRNSKLFIQNPRGCLILNDREESFLKVPNTVDIGIFQDRLVVAGDQLYFYDVNTLEPLLTIEDSGVIHSVGFDQYGFCLVSGQYQNSHSLRVWDISIQKVIRQLPINSNILSLKCVVNGILFRSNHNLRHLVFKDPKGTKRKFQGGHRSDKRVRM